LAGTIGTAAKGRKRPFFEEVTLASRRVSVACAPVTIEISAFAEPSMADSNNFLYVAGGTLTKVNVAALSLCHLSRVEELQNGNSYSSISAENLSFTPFAKTQQTGFLAVDRLSNHQRHLNHSADLGTAYPHLLEYVT
jgi:hypothetical protein